MVAATGLSAADQAAWEAGLSRSHAIRVQVRILDKDHKLVGVADEGVLGGQVDIDTTQAVDRSCSVQIIDRTNRLGLQSASTSAASLVANRMVQVVYGVRIHGLAWVDVPVFTGPITVPSREGSVVTLQAHGKESLLVGACSVNARWKKGVKKTDIIRGLLALDGETRMEIPDLPAKATVDTVVAPLDSLWDRAQGWARSLGMRLFYDGRGVACLRSPQKSPVWVVRPANMLDEPTISSDTTRVRNLVVVTGQEKKTEKPIQYVAAAQASHPMSAVNLGRGIPRKPHHIREDIDEQGIETVAQAKELAQMKLSEFLQAGHEHQTRILPAPHLEPWDLLSLQTGTEVATTMLQKSTLPLDGGGQTIGHHGVTRTIRGGRR